MWLDDVLHTVFTPFRWIDQGLTKVDKALGGVPGALLKGFETVSQFAGPRVKAIGEALSIGQEVVKDLGRYQTPETRQPTTSNAHLVDMYIKPKLEEPAKQLLNIKPNITGRFNPYMGKSNTYDSKFINSRPVQANKDPFTTVIKTPKQTPRQTPRIQI
jgi:hypothetical protein